MLSTYQVNKLVCKYAIRGTLHNIVYIENYGILLVVFLFILSIGLLYCYNL